MTAPWTQHAELLPRLASAHSAAPCLRLDEAHTSGKRTQPLAGDLPVSIEQNSPVQRAVFEFHLIDVEATRPNAFEGDRLQSAEPADQPFDVVGLRTGRS